MLNENMVDFIARCRFNGWVCYQLASGVEVNDTPTEYQIESIKKGVRFVLENPSVTPEENHDFWMKCRLEDGWVYGSVLDKELKTHPSIVPFEELSENEQTKDVMDILMTQKFKEVWHLFNLSAGAL